MAKYLPLENADFLLPVTLTTPSTNMYISMIRAVEFHSVADKIQ